MEFIRAALENSINDGCIIPQAVNNYVDIFSNDRRYKLKWRASNCYKKGCSTGIISYKNSSYYFNLSGTVLHVERYY